MGISRTFALALLLYALPAHASRTLMLAPVTMSTVHGGSDGSTYCATADMNQIAPNAGVLAALHYYNFSFRNLSGVDQHVTVMLEPGTSIGSHYSPPGSPAPSATGPSVSISSATNISFIIPANSVKTLVLTMGCTKNSCFIGNGSSNVLAGSMDPLLSGPACGPSTANCVTEDDIAIFRIVVAEDRGAISATLGTSAHRACGLADHYVAPPPFIQINGGRPF